MEEDGIDLFLIGIHFDDSRALELVSAIRINPNFDQTPIVILRIMPTQLVGLLRTTISALVKVKAVTSYVELADDPNSETKLRAAVEAALPEAKAVLA